MGEAPINKTTPSARAVAAFRAALNPDQVSDDETTLARYARTTQVSATQPACIVYPQSTEDVQAALEVAQQQDIVVYPISRGLNWGYGDACAPTDGAAILDLSRMNQILEVNSELAYAVIEPGVTQQQLFEHLQQSSSKLWADCTGAGLEASLIGNTLERGFGHTRYGDHFSTACGMEIVLADGRVLRTGFTHYANAKSGRVYPYGVGPQLDGLFCQSNFGIVTKLGLWLMPEPEAFSTFFIPVKREDDIVPLIKGLRELRLHGLLQSAIHIANDLRLISAATTYPWDATGGNTPLPENVRKEMRESRGYGHWNVAGSLVGTRDHVRGSRRALQDKVRGLGKLIVMNDAKIRLAENVLRPLNALGMGKRLTEQLEALKPNHGLLKGVPTNVPRQGVHWRVRKTPDNRLKGPLETGAGLYWISPILPARGEDAQKLHKIIVPIFTEHGFEPLLTFTFVNDRALAAILNVAFDKNQPAEAEAAAKCYHETLTRVIEAGYHPYRVGLNGMADIRSGDDAFWQVAQDIKGALDPNDIVARGRYVPPLESS